MLLNANRMFEICSIATTDYKNTAKKDTRGTFTCATEREDNRIIIKRQMCCDFRVTYTRHSTALRTLALYIRECNDTVIQ